MAPRRGNLIRFGFLQSPPKNDMGRVVGYFVYLGTQAELRKQRFFVHRNDAERFVAQHATTPVPIGEPCERKAEIPYALERLRPLGMNLTLGCP